MFKRVENHNMKLKVDIIQHREVAKLNMVSHV
jgi:hypothetical protein